MAHDETSKRSDPDRAYISMSEDYGLRVWARSFGVTLCQLRDAVQTVGNAAEDVRLHLAQLSR